MATDATGTPTSPDNIPTYNTAVDAPSGKGFNAAMAAIQTALNSRPATPAGIATGEAMVWNGTTFVRSSVTQITANGVAGVVKSPYRKTTSKQVVNTTTETDLLNGEITVGAGALGTSQALRLTAWGDMVNTTGGTQSTPRWKVKLGASTLLDSNIMGAVWTSSPTRTMWRLGIEIAELNATNVQLASMSLEHNAGLGANATVFFTTGTGQYQAFVTASGWGFWKAEGFGAGAVDTTVAQALAVTVTLPVANAALDVTLKGAVAEIL